MYKVTLNTCTCSQSQKCLGAYDIEFQASEKLFHPFVSVAQIKFCQAPVVLQNVCF